MCSINVSTQYHVFIQTLMDLLSAKPSDRQSGEYKVYQTWVFTSDNFLSINKGARPSVYITPDIIILGNTSRTRPWRFNNR